MESEVTTVSSFLDTFGFQLMILGIVVGIYIVTRLILDYLHNKNLIDEKFKSKIFKSIFKSTDNLVDAAKKKHASSGEVIETIQNGLEETIEPKEVKKEKKTRKPRKTKPAEEK